jgi:hypothetical protein
VELQVLQRIEIGWRISFASAIAVEEMEENVRDAQDLRVPALKDRRVD